MACFVFDGIDYAGTFEVASIEMSALPTTVPDLRSAAGRDGSYLASNPLSPLEIRVEARIATGATDPRDIQRIYAEAVAPLRTADPRPLFLTEGLHRLAVLAEESPLEFKTYSATAKLKFICPDPVAYGEEKTFTVPSGGSRTFTVGGTYPAKPRITASAVRNASSLVWGLRLDEGDYIHVATGSGSSRAVAIDCGERTLKVAGSAALPTLDSDWLGFEPGEHVLRMDNGTGAATVSYVERWL